MFDTCIIDQFESRVEKAAENAACEANDADCLAESRQATFEYQFECAYTDESQTAFSGDVKLRVSVTNAAATAPGASSSSSDYIADSKACFGTSGAMSAPTSVCAAGR